MTSRLLFCSSLLAVAAWTGCSGSDEAPGTGDDAGSGTEDGGTLPPSTDCTPIPTDCSAPLELKAADIEAGATLPAGSCYAASGALKVQSGVLRAEEGVVIQFAAGASLEAGSGAQLHLVGSCARPVVLTSNDTASSWKGVRLTDSQGTDNVFEYAVIERAGDTNWTGAEYSATALDLGGTTTLRMDHVTLRESKAHGLIARESVDFTFDNGAFVDNVTPAYLHPQVASRIAGTTVLEGNTNPYIRLSFSNNDSIEGEQRWAALPFQFEQRTYLGGQLTVEPGATLRFAQEVSLITREGSTLTARGTADAPIRFVGAANDQRGFWQGLRIGSGGVGDPATIGATFEHCVIDGAGSTQWTGAADSKAAVFLHETSAIAMSHTTVRNSGWYALSASEDARLSTFANNTFTANGRTMVLHPDRVGELGGDNTLSGNDEDRIRLVFSNTNAVSKAASWRPQGIPYLVQDRFYVNAALQVEAGTTLEFAQERELIVGEEGSLTASGTSEMPVVLRGANAVATGYWKGLRIGSNDPANQLNHTTIEHAGSAGWTGNAQSDAALFLDANASMALADVTLGPGGGHGIFVSSNPQPLTCSNVTFGSLVKGAVWQASPSPGALLPGCP